MDLASGCSVSQAYGFLQSARTDTIMWANVSPVQATDETSFLKAAANKHSQQVLCARMKHDDVQYFAVPGPISASNLSNLTNTLKKDEIHPSQALPSLTHAAKAGGYVNLVKIKVPKSGQPTVTFEGSMPLGWQLQSVLMPLCGGQPNWLSIGFYVVVVLLVLGLLWQFG